jgi:hypothetical protein
MGVVGELRKIVRVMRELLIGQVKSCPGSSTELAVTCNLLATQSEYIRGITEIMRRQLRSLAPAGRPRLMCLPIVQEHRPFGVLLAVAVCAPIVRPVSEWPEEMSV